jgi:ubiquinone/menaquinone biosynthesis C-methylase UbiE
VLAISKLKLKLKTSVQGVLSLLGHARLCASTGRTSPLSKQRSNPGILFCICQIVSQRTTKSEIAAAYNEWAETYDTDENRTRDLAAQVLRQANLSFAGRKVIEAGCATGRNTDWLASSAAGAAGIVALDFSEEMLTRARNRVRDPRVRFVQHDVRSNWPIPDASADVVIAMLVLEHVELLEPFFVEASRTLNIDGQLFICELHPTRQLMGKQTRFTNARTGEQTLVPAFLQQTDDYRGAEDAGGITRRRQQEEFSSALPVVLR